MTGKSTKTTGGGLTPTSINGLVWRIPLFCFLSFFDVVATQLLSKWGDVEMNPMYNLATANNVTILEAKLLLMAFIVFIVLWLADNGHRPLASSIIKWANGLYFTLACLQIWGITYAFG